MFLMIAYSIDELFFSVLEAIDFVVFFDFYIAYSLSIGMVYGEDGLNYEDLNLKIKHF